VKSGRLAFVSDGAGSGACYLNCHGEEHGPKSYGAMRLQIGMIGAPRVLPVAPTIPTLPDPARERPVVRDRERMRP